MPYNNIRIQLPFMFMVICALIKTYIRIVTFVNWFIYKIAWLVGQITFNSDRAERTISKLNYVLIADGLCPDLDNWYFAPGANTNKEYAKQAGKNQPSIKNAADIEIKGKYNNVYLLEQTYNKLTRSDAYETVLNMDNFKERCSEIYDYLHSFHISDSKIETSLMFLSVFAYETNNFTKENFETVLKETDIGKVILTSEDSVKYVNQLYSYLMDSTGEYDTTSIDFTNKDENESSVCLTTNIDYLVSCIEMNLAQEYKVISFDFYND